MATSRTRRTAIGAVVAGFLLLVGTAVATTGSGIIRAPVQARGTLEPTTGQVLAVNSKSGVHVKTHGSVDLVTQEIAIGPGGHTGWHSHPGPVLVTVKEGSLRLIYANDASCQGSVYEAGDSFVDRGDENAHIARASPFTGVVLWATYFVPGTPGSTAFRIDEADPGTGC
jgi:quercetin dioxygenase-like cupin family protein